MNFSVRLCLFLATTALSSSVLQAQLFEWKASGTISKVTNPGQYDDWTSGVIEGTPFTFDFTFDSQAAPIYKFIGSPPAFNTAIYPGLSGSAKIGSTNFVFTGPENLSIFSSSDPTFPLFIVELDHLTFEAPPFVDIALSLFSTSSSMPDVAPPSTILPFTDADVFKGLDVSEDSPGLPSWSASGKVDLFEIVPLSPSAVPEPSTFEAFAALGLIGLTLARLRRRKNLSG